MEKMINEMLDAGLSVSFESRTFVMAKVNGTQIWWHGQTLEEVYLQAIELGHVRK